MVLDRRFLIEEDIETVQAEIADVLNRVESARPGFRYDLREIATGALHPDHIGPRLASWRAAIDDLVEHDAHSESGYRGFLAAFDT